MRLPLSKTTSGGMLLVMSRRIVLTIGAILFVSAAVYGLVQFKKNTSPSGHNEKISVVASFYPLGHFAEKVGGEQTAVMTITPAGTEPHDYEPSPQQIASLYQAKLVIANGAGLDPWVINLRTDLEHKGVAVVVMSEHVDLLKSEDEELPADPHFWLDPLLAEREVQAITQAMMKIDTAHKEVYESRGAAYGAELQALHQRYETGLGRCGTRSVVTSHAVFGYLAKQYDLIQISIAGLSPDEEPSTRRLAELVTEIRQKNISHIFFETLVSPKLAETLAKEVGAQTLVFNPLEGLLPDEIAQGKNYISVMQDNLSQLRIALQCT